MHDQNINENTDRTSGTASAWTTSATKVGNKPDPHLLLRQLNKVIFGVAFWFWSRGFINWWNTITMWFAGPTETPSDGLQVCWHVHFDPRSIAFSAINDTKGKKTKVMCSSTHSATSATVQWMDLKLATTKQRTQESSLLVLLKRPKAATSEKVDEFDMRLVLVCPLPPKS